MNVRLARIKDLDTLVQLEEICFPQDSDAFNRRIFRYFLAKSSSICLVVMVQKRIVGYCILSLRKNSQRARIYSIALNPLLHGSGAAQKLLKEAEAVARRRGKVNITLEVRKTNLRAQKFYHKHGYICFAEQDNYYQDGGAALRMRKVL